MQAFLASQEDVPPLRYELPKGDATLPLKQGASVPTVTGQANGHEASFILDTGASDLILGEEDARRYGVKPLDKHGNTNGWISKGVPTQAGVLDTLQLGEITLHNVPVTIVPNPIHLIGGNLLAPLGTLRISSQAVQVYGADSTVPACDSPMLTSSALWGNGLRLLPRLDVNGQPQSVLLDTGASKYLLGTRAALDQATALHRRTSQLHDIGGNHALVHGDAAKVQITLAGQPFDMLFEVYTDATQNTHPITLGAGALRDMDFLLDYRHQHQCFLLHPNLR
nr:aspartyl protease family protein [Dyella sp. ASV21]